MVIDFSSGMEIPNRFSGSEKKKTILYDGKRYLVKFPDPMRQKNAEISYINNVFSEYIGSQIFQSTGMCTQNTLLGIYTVKDGKKKNSMCV